jgi:hypothetical protein
MTSTFNLHKTKEKPHSQQRKQSAKMPSKVKFVCVVKSSQQTRKREDWCFRLKRIKEKVSSELM